MTHFSQVEFVRKISLETVGGIETNLLNYKIAIGYRTDMDFVTLTLFVKVTTDHQVKFQPIRAHY